MGIAVISLDGGVLLCGATRMGKLVPEAVRFSEKNRKALQSSTGR